MSAGVEYEAEARSEPRDGTGVPIAQPVALSAASAAPLPPARARPSRGRWLLLLGLVVALGLGLGALAAAQTAPDRRGTVVAATAQPARTGGPGGDGTGAERAREGTAARGGPLADAGPGGGLSGAGAGPAGARSGASGRTAGVITGVEGDTLIVSTADGPVRVQLGSDTTVQKQVPAERDELAPGQRVMVSGERGGEGTVAASGVQIVSGDGPSAAAETPVGRGGREAGGRR